MRKRPHQNATDASENYSRSHSSPPSVSNEDGLEGAKSGLGINADRINQQSNSGFQRPDLTSSGATRHNQDQNGWNGIGEAEEQSSHSATGQNSSVKVDDVTDSPNVFEAIGRWSNAVKLMSASLDRQYSFDEP